ncbi:MAG: dCTP deaminase [Deltaproteobacteria bacterium]|nr:dCTP deaminase [Deltaproteobacteria bacterium]
MTILARSAIFNEIDRGNIVIDPFLPDSVGPASVDLRLSHIFRLFKSPPDTIRVWDETDYRATTTRLVTSDGRGLVLAPGQTALGMTIERIRLADSICGWIDGRSRFARLGLLVHISAGFIQPGIDNHQVLELFNFGPHPLELVSGTKICQFIFCRTEGQGSYALSGRFATQCLDNF